MEIDLALGGFSLEIRGHSANLECHLWPHIVRVTDEIAGRPALEVLSADPLVQIALDCFRVGEAVKGQIAKAKAGYDRYDDEPGG
jgi:hypothetical protein